MIVVIVVMATGRGGGGGGHTVRVGALWYGQTQNGEVTAGVTPVDIAAVNDDPKTPLSVDLRGLQAAGAGPMWAAATAVGGVQAALISGIDPRLHQFKYSLREAIDGPSAGALLSVGSLAALSQSPISRSTTMTGTVLPDGSVGRVAGVAAKLRAAARAGYTRVLIPAELSSVVDPKTGQVVDPVRLGQSLGVKVTRVENIPDAFALMTGQRERSSARKPPPIKAGILRMLTQRSRALISVARRQSRALSSAPGASARSARAKITLWVGAAERGLARDDPVYAFTASSEAAQAGLEAVASAHLHAVTGTTLGERSAQVERMVKRSLASIGAQVRKTAEFPAAKVAQLTALSDTLSWGVFALTSLRVAQQRLATVRTESQLDEIVRFVEVARFEAGTFMSVCAASLPFLGSRPIANVDSTVGLTNAYADLIAYGANTNRTYAKSLGLGASDASYLRDLIEESDALTRAGSFEFLELRGPTARPALRLSVALLEYVETTQLVNDLTDRNARGNEGPPNLAPIRDLATVPIEARSADEIARRQIRDIAAAGLDPSFVQWNSQWGADLAFRRLPGTTSEQTLHGLEFQWFAVLQSRLLTALSRA